MEIDNCLERQRRRLDRMMREPATEKNKYGFR